MERMRNHNNGHRNLYIIIAILVILLVSTFGYLGYLKYKENKLEAENKLREEGFIMGVENTVVQLMNQAVTCVPVPVTYNNQTINVFALECPNLAEVATTVLQQRMSAQQQTEEVTSEE